MSAPAIELRSLSLRLGSFALRELSIAVAGNEILVLLGPNGAGKSVCLETIAGFHRPSHGQVMIAGRDVTTLPPERRHIGFVVQNFALFPHLTVIENVAIGCRRRGPAGEIGALLSRFGIAQLASSRPEHLSPGEKQRVALARALASRPELFLFDEPFAALDATASEALRGDLLGWLRRSGVSAIFVTHDRAEALALGDRVAVIEAGAILQQGPAEVVFARPNSIAVARFVGVENLLEGRVEGAGGALLRVSTPAGTVLAASSSVSSAPGDAVILCIRAENIHLLPPHSSRGPNLLDARVIALRRSGPLWRVTLDCGAALVTYALPQTVAACGLAPGSAVEAAIDPGDIHLLPAEAGESARESARASEIPSARTEDAAVRVGCGAR